MHGEMAQVFLIKSFEYIFESSIYPQFVRRKSPGLYVIFLLQNNVLFFIVKLKKYQTCGVEKQFQVN